MVIGYGEQNMLLDYIFVLELFVIYTIFIHSIYSILTILLYYLYSIHSVYITIAKIKIG